MQPSFEKTKEWNFMTVMIHGQGHRTVLGPLNVDACEGLRALLFGKICFRGQKNFGRDLNIRHAEGSIS